VPIVRTGNIAAMVDEPVKTGYTAQPIDAYLIEARSIGGLSGSPVFVRRPAAEWQVTGDRNENNIPIAKAELNKSGYIFYLLGIVHGHFPAKSAEVDMVEEDSQFNDKFNTGIGVVVPVNKVYDTLFQPELIDSRKAVIDDKNKANPGAIEDIADGENENEGFEKKCRGEI